MAGPPSFWLIFFLFDVYVLHCPWTQGKLMDSTLYSDLLHLYFFAHISVRSHRRTMSREQKESLIFSLIFVRKETIWNKSGAAVIWITVIIPLSGRWLELVWQCFEFVIDRLLFSWQHFRRTFNQIFTVPSSKSPSMQEKEAWRYYCGLLQP